MPWLQSETYNKDVVRFYSNESIRSAILDIRYMSVYLFKGNRRIIATEQMNQNICFVINLCKTWIHDGVYEEADFAA